MYKHDKRTRNEGLRLGETMIGRKVQDWTYH